MSGKTTRELNKFINIISYGTSDKKMNKVLDRILEDFTEEMCYNDEREPGSEPYLMVYNANTAYNQLEDCPRSHYYYYSFYIYVSMIKERVLYET